MIDIESRVADSLHARVDRGIKVGELHGGAVARAGRIRRRRRAAGVVAAAGVAAVLTAGIAAAPRLLPAGGTANQSGGTGNAARPSVGDPKDPATPPTAGGPTTLPEAAGVPAAAERPAAVGADPSVLHFDVNLVAVNASSSDWVSGPGYEGVVLAGGVNARPIEVFIGPNASTLQTKLTPPGMSWMLSDGTRITNYATGPAESVTINGRPGTLKKLTAADRETSLQHPAGVPESKIEALVGSDSSYAWVLTWQPVDGLNAVVSVRNRDKAVALATAEAMRLDRAQRCAVPATVTHVPAGATLSECRTAVRRTPIAGRGVWVSSQLKLRKPGVEASVWLEDAKRPRHKHDTSQFTPQLTVAGHPAQWLTADPKGLWILNFGAAEVFVSGVGKDEAVRIAGGLTITTDLFHPETWPKRPVG